MAWVTILLRQIRPDTDLILEIFTGWAILMVDALTTARASTTLRAATCLFLASTLVKETQMTQQSLNNAIYSFAFSGVLAPHRRPPASTTPTQASQQSAPPPKTK